MKSSVELDYRGEKLVVIEPTEICMKACKQQKLWILNPKM